MIDHITLNVSDYPRSRSFYIRAMETLGYAIGHEWETGCGFHGADGWELWIRQEGKAGAPVHVAFRVGDRRVVHAFHAAALAAGGQDNGGPGPRGQYGPTYYAAFVLDPDGNNIEAVTHAEEGS